MLLITAGEAAEIRGVSVQWVYNLASSGELIRHAPPHLRRASDHAEVEARSLARLSRPLPPRHPYWASAKEAAIELGITAAAVRRMMLEDRLPYVTALNGRRYIRRHQLEVIANVRESRAQELPVEGGWPRKPIPDAAPVIGRVSDHSSTGGADLKLALHPRHRTTSALGRMGTKL